MVTIPTPWRESPLTQEEQDLLFMLSVDDTEDAPWIVMGDLQFWSASSLAHSLRIYGRRSGLRWYVASRLPIDHEWPGLERKKTVAPDVFVSFVEDHLRTSYDLTAEGVFPAFVLEVVSPSNGTLLPRETGGHRDRGRDPATPGQATCAERVAGARSTTRASSATA